MLWELMQQTHIRKAKSDASEAVRDTTKASTDIIELEAQVNHLSLVCRAMWSLIRQQTDLSEQMLIARVKDLDLSDGTKDNKFRQTRECYGCGKTIGPKEENCIYCGVKIPIGNAFNKV